MAEKKLAGSVALVTGGAERVGRVISESLAECGAVVAINHREQQSQATATTEAIREAGGHASAHDADISSPEACRDLVDTVVAEHGRLDFVVHNASSFVATPFFETTTADYDKAFDVLVRGPYFLSQAAARHMQERGSGKIIAVVGNSYFEGWPLLTAHSIAKAAVVKMMQILSVTLGPQVQCHAVCPAHILDSVGTTNTDLRARRREVSDGNLLRLADDVLVREGRPEDVAELISYLCGSTPYLNGALIAIDGGKSNF
ncbi:SDR family NAD(P)-dependent oxidoreductase [Streptomyces shenzhenensis]